MHDLKDTYPDCDNYGRPPNTDTVGHVRNLVAFHAVSELEICARECTRLEGSGCLTESACATCKSRKAGKCLNLIRGSRNETYAAVQNVQQIWKDIAGKEIVTIELSLVRNYDSLPRMYNTAADIHFSGVYTLSHENPTAIFNNVMTINMSGLQLPKSGDKNVISHNIVNITCCPHLNNSLTVKTVQFV